MHHLILYTFTFALCNAVFGYTHHGEIWGMFRLARGVWRPCYGDDGGCWFLLH